MPEKRVASDHLGSPSKRVATHSRESTTIELKNSVVEALDELRVDEAISQATAVLQDLQASTVNMLELRARGWSKKAKYGEELKDALTMIQAVPDYPGGYLHAGKLYSMLGYQNDAMETLKKGLDHVPPSCKSYRDIQQEYEKAKLRSERRVDFIAECPYDIVSFIVEHIADDATVESTMVSHVWRARILECQTRWEEFEVDNSNQIYYLFPAVARHIEKLKLGISPVFLSKCFRLMYELEFPRLRSLEVTGDGIDWINSKHISKLTMRQGCKPDVEYHFANDFCALLPSISSSLTDLHITKVTSGLPPLVVILAICRNLTKLRLEGTAFNHGLCSGSFLRHTTLLTHLTLDTFNESISPTEFGSLLRCSPSLKYLRLEESSTDMLLPIQQYCHNLTHLLFNSSAVNRQYYPISNLPSGTLQYLILGGNFTVDAVQPVIQAHHDSLTTMILSPEDDFEAQRDWRPMANYSFSSLTHLYIKPSAYGFSTILPALIRQCPNLTSFRFEGCEEKIDGHVFDALRQLGCLNCLYIHGAVLDVADSCLTRMLKKSSLLECTMIECYGLTDEVLEAVASIRSLHLLRIDGGYSQFTCAAVEEFTRLLGLSAYLQDLSLYYIELSDVAVQDLCRSISLAELELANCRISEKGLDIIEECPFNVDAIRN